MTALEVTYGGKTKPLRDWVRGVSLRDKARLGTEERINFRDVVNVVSGLCLGQHFADIAPEYPTFSVLVTETNRKQLVDSTLRNLAGGKRTKEAIAILDAMELLDGDRLDPSRSRYAGEVLNRSAAKKNLDVLAVVECLLELVAELGGTAAYLSQAEMILSSDHPWVKQARATRKDVLDKLAKDRAAQHAGVYRQSLAQLKKDYVAAYIAQHSKARLGVAEDKTKSALRKDPRLVAMRALAGISMMHPSQLTAFEDKLDKLKSCAALVDSELMAGPKCPHCGFVPANEQGDLLPASRLLTAMDEELDHLIDGWRQRLLNDLEDPIVQANFDLVKKAKRDLIKDFIASKNLPDPVPADFVSALQDALSNLERIDVTSDEIKQALLHGGSPATPDDLRKRFETFLNDRCKGKDAGKLRFVIE